MITKERFAEIRTEVESSINEAFDLLKDTSESNYALFLAVGEFSPLLDTNPQMSPYVIDDRTWFYDDETRQIFLHTFLNTFYSFPKEVIQVEDDEFRLNLELMVYSHVWESNSFLKMMYRLAHLVNGEAYSWKVEIPEMGKHDFIRNDIKEFFHKKSLSLYEIIPKGFNSSLRNAFAHSQYNIRTESKKIYLSNYKGDDRYQIKSLTFDEWSERFSYSIWLSYLLMNIHTQRRKSIITDYGKDTFSIDHPKRDGTIKQVDIVFEPERNSVTFEVNLKK